MNDELRAELLERAGRDQAARNWLPPGGSHDKWQEIVAPVDEANTSGLGLEPEHENRAWLLALDDPG